MKTTCHALLLGLGLLTGAPGASAADSTGTTAARPASVGKAASDTRARQAADPAPQPAANQAGSEAAHQAAALSPARRQERDYLLKSGEAALSRRDVAAALRDFDRASLILHAADTEMALIRSYMQGGEYRRALAFGAHTAGAHLDVVDGTALYAWLLQAGGQGAIAQRLLTEAQARSAPNAVVDGVLQQLRAGAPLASGALLALPARLAPYGDRRGLPGTARVVGSGMLLPGGELALVPLALVPRTGHIWLRNGLGQLAKARVRQRLPAAGVALMQLATRLPPAQEVWVAARDAFPGSAAYAVEYVSAPDATPAWPMLRSGFLGRVAEPIAGAAPEQLLGIALPAGPRGGPVFNAAGQLAGLALPGRAGAPDRLVPASQLRKALGASRSAVLGPAPPAGSEPRAALDQIYENSLKASLQVIAAAP